MVDVFITRYTVDSGNHHSGIPSSRDNHVRVPVKVALRSFMCIVDQSSIQPADPSPWGQRLSPPASWRSGQYESERERERETERVRESQRERQREEASS